jgi:hypothetical protein
MTGRAKGPRATQVEFGPASVVHVAAQMSDPYRQRR